MSFLATSAVYAKADEQGCESSGGQAAGCTSNTVSPAITVNPTIGVSNELRNFSTNNNNSLGVGVGGTQSQTQTANGGAGGAGGSGGAGGTGSGVSNANAGATATNAGNNQSITVQAASIPRQAPDSAVVIASPTAPCRISQGVGGSGTGFSLQIGGSTLDEGCDAREDARMLFNMGLKDQAIARLCAKPEMKVALGSRCTE